MFFKVYTAKALVECVSLFYEVSIVWINDVLTQFTDAIVEPHLFVTPVYQMHPKIQIDPVRVSASVPLSKRSYCTRLEGITSRDHGLDRKDHTDTPGLFRDTWWGTKNLLLFPQKKLITILITEPDLLKIGLEKW